MKRIIFFLLLIFALPVLADEPYAFKGYKLGAKKSDLELQVFSCNPSKTALSDISCTTNHQNVWIGNIKPELVMLHFYNDTLSSIYVALSEKDFNAVSEAMIAKLGTPSSSKTEHVQNRMGASFQNQRMAWSNSFSKIEIDQRSGQIDRSAIRYKLNSYDEEFIKRQKGSIKAAADDL
jgi:hypothetical protein